MGDPSGGRLTSAQPIGEPRHLASRIAYASGQLGAALYESALGDVAKIVDRMNLDTG